VRKEVAETKEEADANLMFPALMSWVEKGIVQNPAHEFSSTKKKLIAEGNRGLKLKAPARMSNAAPFRLFNRFGKPGSGGWCVADERNVTYVASDRRVNPQRRCLPSKKSRNGKKNKPLKQNQTPTPKTNEKHGGSRLTKLRRSALFKKG